MRRFVTTLAALALCFCVSTAVAQDEGAAHPELNAWVGSWSATGTMMGMDATANVTWEWVLGGHHYLQGTQTVSLTTPDGPLSWDAIFFMIPADDGTINGYQMQSTGEHFPMPSTVVDGNIVMNWEDSMGTHRYTVVVTDDGATGAHETQGEDGTWTNVGGMTYVPAS